MTCNGLARALADINCCMRRVACSGDGALGQVDADGSGTLDIMEFYKLISDMKDHGHWTLEMYTGMHECVCGRAPLN